MRENREKIQPQRDIVKKRRDVGGVPDWNAIKAEYIVGEISYRKLSEKWGVSFRTLADHARKEGWAKERNRHRNNVTKRTVQKVAARTAATNANRLLRLQQAADNMGEVIAEVFGDAEQFHRHIVQTRNGDAWDAVERIFDKVDTKAIKDLTGAMKDLAYVIRNIYDLPTKQEQSAMDIAAGRLAIERDKAHLGTVDDNETGVVEITAVLREDDGNDAS